MYYDKWKVYKQFASKGCRKHGFEGKNAGFSYLSVFAMICHVSTIDNM